MITQTDNLQSITPHIDQNRRYWLIRTMGGNLFDTYVQNNFIAIGYNEILLDEIRLSISKSNPSQYLKRIIASKDVNVYAAGQLLRFVNEIQKNDLIIIPNRLSGSIQIGVICSDIYEIEKVNITNDCVFTKRRDVEWLKSIGRYELSPQLQLMFNSRHIVSNIDTYASFIDSIVNDFFIKDNHTYLKLQVSTNNEISGSDFSVISELLCLFDDFCATNDINQTSDDIKIKIQLQSPGDIVMSAINFDSMAIIAFLIILINGGSVKIEKIGLDINTPGIIAEIKKYLDNRNDRIIKNKTAEKLNSLEISNPQDLVNMIKEINKSRDKY